MILSIGNVNDQSQALLLKKFFENSSLKIEDNSLLKTNTNEDGVFPEQDKNINDSNTIDTTLSSKIDSKISTIMDEGEQVNTTKNISENEDLETNSSKTNTLKSELELKDEKSNSINCNLCNYEMT